jgi:hypothetical protein
VALRWNANTNTLREKSDIQSFLVTELNPENRLEYVLGREMNHGLLVGYFRSGNKSGGIPELKKEKLRRGLYR